MFKFKGKSPMEQFYNIVKIWALLSLVLLGSCGVGMKLDQPYTEKKSYNAVMVNAYSSYKNCGHKGRYECEIFKGRFKVDVDGKYYERDIDGFFYTNYIDKGKQDMPAYITLSPNDMGVQTPGYITFLQALGFFGILVTIAGAFMLMFAAIEVEGAQQNWDYRKQREDHQRRY